MMQHQLYRIGNTNCLLLSALAILLLASNCPTPTHAEKCYQASKPITFVRDFGSFITGGGKDCPNDAKAKGCYEWHTKLAGRVQYKAGCDAKECPASSGFDPKLHTCIKCKHSALDTVANVGNTLCATASFLTANITYDLKHKCEYQVQGVILEDGKVVKADPDHGPVYCNEDKKCGVSRWTSSNSGKETNYTGCMSDCNAQLQAASGNASSDTCIECTDKADCATKLPKVATVVPGAVGTTPAPRVLGTGPPVTPYKKGCNGLARGGIGGKAGAMLAVFLVATVVAAVQ